MIESALYILTGIAFYGGAHQLYLGARLRPAYPHVLHGAMYVLLATFAWTNALTYQPQGITNLVPLGKLTVTVGILLWATLAWFVAAYTHFKPRLVLAGLTAAWTVLLIGNIGSPYSLLYSDISPLSQTLPSGETQWSWQTTASPWWTVLQLTVLASLSFCLYAGYRLFQANDKRASLALISGLLVLAIMSLSDLLVYLQMTHYAYLAPFGFVVLLVASSLYPSMQGYPGEPHGERAPANLNVTFNLTQPPLRTDLSYPSSPLSADANVEIHQKPRAGLTIKQARPTFTVRPEKEREAAAPTEPPSAGKAEVAAIETPEQRTEADTALKKTAVPAPQQGRTQPESEPDETTLAHVSDNLIDIAVYATMALNRFKRGDADLETLETLCKKVRTHAINTRRLAVKLSQRDKDRK